MQSRRSLLTISRTGEVQLITLLAAVHLTPAGGQLHVQLGQVRDGSIEITGVLAEWPGSTRRCSTPGWWHTALH